MARQPNIIIAVWTGAGGRNTAQIRDGRGRVLIRRVDFHGRVGRVASTLACAELPIQLVARVGSEHANTSGARLDLDPWLAPAVVSLSRRGDEVSGEDREWPAETLGSATAISPTRESTAGPLPARSANGGKGNMDSAFAELLRTRLLAT